MKCVLDERGGAHFLTNKVRNKETHERMHGRDIRSGQDSNQ